MATINPFDLLGDDDTDDPMQLLAAHQQKILLTPEKAPAQPKPNAAQAARDAKTESQRGGGRGRDGARGRGSNQDSYGNSNGFAGGYRQQEDGEGGKPFESRGGYGGGYRRFKDGEGGKPFEKRGGYGGGYRQSEDGEGGKPFESRGGYGGGYRQFEDGEGGKRYERRGGYGGSRGGFRGDLSNGDGEYPCKVYDSRSGTGRGSDFKREGSGHGNWGTPTDENAREAEEPMNGVVNDGVKIDGFEKQHEQEDAGDAKKDYPSDKPKVNKPEDKSMTLDQYEKLLEEKRKALLTSKPEERKVCLDKEFEAMQLLANKKNDDEVFRKLGSEKEEKKKEAGEKVKKTKSIHEFLKPVGFRPGGRGRGRGRGRGGYDGNDTTGTGGNGVNNTSTTAGFETPSIEAPSIEDVRQFPTLGSK